MKPANPSARQEIIFELYKIGAVKLGEFTLKSGAISPIYIDLRLIISYPAMLRAIAAQMWEKISGARFDLICGIPYTALPIATCMSLENNIPMIMRRKEKKTYGTKKIIEGHFQSGQICLLIEDVITSGSSVLETADELEAAGLIVKDVMVFIDREQGGKENLQKRNYTVHSTLTLKEILTSLMNSDILANTEKDLLDRFIIS